MSHDLQHLIPPIDDAGRAKRIQAEHKILDRILKVLDDPELDHTAFQKTMREYCELKKQDNLHERNLVHLAAAQARLSDAQARAAVAQARIADSATHNSASRRSRLRGSQDATRGTLLDEIPAANEPIDQSWATDDPAASTDAAPIQHDSRDFQHSTSDFRLSAPAPWGRRRNGSPRTRAEHMTLLNRAISDIYGLGAVPEPIPADHRTARFAFNARTDNHTLIEAPAAGCCVMPRGGGECPVRLLLDMRQRTDMDGRTSNPSGARRLRAGGGTDWEYAIRQSLVVARTMPGSIGIMRSVRRSPFASGRRD